MVFISYSSKDYPAACKIRELLESRGIVCWMAPESIPGGSSYLKEIPAAIGNSVVFLLILSHNAQMSKWVPKELDRAINKDKPVIPFKIDAETLNESFELALCNVQRIDASREPEKAWDELVRRVKQEAGITRSDNTVSELPSELSYFQMIGIDDISDLSVPQIRKQADVTASLSVPIGINERGERVSLDLHQKGDGPNGLIVGPTGSGKSEFLQTLSLSLCLFFSSEEVRIHIIDLRGGKSFLRMRELQHFGTCLTEDSQDAVYRFMEELESELEKREKLLRRYSAANVYQYLKMRRNNAVGMEPMPHLIVAMDEIRDLKVNYPEVFARIRSWGSRDNAVRTGVHLLMTTQNPMGLVDDFTWNTSNFKICSTMQRSEFETDAAADVSSCPGRLYMQSQTRSRVQLLQLAYCPADISDSVVSEHSWFFGRKSELDEIIRLIERDQMD